MSYVIYIQLMKVWTMSYWVFINNAEGHDRTFDPLSRAMSDHYFLTDCPSVLNSRNQAKIAAWHAGNVVQVVWIIDESCFFISLS